MDINSKISTLSWFSMEDGEIHIYKELVSFQGGNMHEGLKYLGFEKKEWMWLISNLKKRLHIWSYRWFLRSGRLVLTKSLLEAIPDYWMALAWIPKGILELARRLCVIFL